MSLAPAERRTLAQIEDTLRRADPRLDSMLTRFRLPIWRGNLAGVTRRLPRLTPLILLMAAATVLLALVLTIVLSPSPSLPCGARSGAGGAAAAGPVSYCPTAGYRGHNPGGAAGTGAAGITPAAKSG